MIWIILATGLCTANFIAIALLFRRMRHSLNRQLSDMRAERNSEWILRALQGAPEERVRPAQTAGGGSNVSPPYPQPVRRKRHLGLYKGGGAIAAALVGMSAILRCGRQAHGAHLVGAAIGTTALAATTITAMTVAPWQQDVETVPPQPPSTMATTQAPGSPAAPTTPAPGRRSPDNMPAPTTGTPGPTTDTHTGSLQTPAPESATPSTGSTAGSALVPLPVDLLPTVSPSPSSTGATATGSGTCVNISILSAHACLTGGG